MIDDREKIPHRPERTVGRWALSMGNRLFKIDEAYTSMGEAHYLGFDLHGNEVRTSCVTILCITDHEKLEEYHALESAP